MKKKILLILIFIIFAILYFSFRTGRIDSFVDEYLSTSYCQEPVLYKEGSIDPRFGLSRQDVIDASKEAAWIWNNRAGFDVFKYDKQAKLEINMVYDQRQSMDSRIRSLEENLESGRTTLDQEVANYRNELAQFEIKNDEFSRKVNEWNSNQGGTQEEYDALIREQDALANEAERLNAIGERLNVSTFEYNNQVDQFNKSIDTFNKVLDEKPEEGLFDPLNYEIDIYFNNEREKLIRTIAHELGHARGLGHTNDENDMMYPITTSVLELSEKDLELLNEICEPYPVYEPYVNNFKNNLLYFKESVIKF